PSAAALWCLDMSALPPVPYEVVGRREPGKGYRLRVLPTEDVSFFMERSRSMVGISTVDPNLTNFFTVIQPADFDKRIVNQAGLFSIYVTFRGQPDQLVTDHLKYLLDLEKSVGRDILNKLIILPQDKEEIKYDLLRTNIDHTFVFPDLSGLGLLLTEKYN